MYLLAGRFPEFEQALDASKKTLLFKVYGAGDKEYRIYTDGTTEGFSDLTGVQNMYPILRAMRSKQAA